jgi:23S rRNA pseudouridine955/2504/2580 synthase
MENVSKDFVTRQTVGEEGENQRIDNYLATQLKGVPKSHIYRIVRSGEVRVNSRRVDPAHRLRAGDELRIPPLRMGKSEPVAIPTPRRFDFLHEDDALLAIDKPAGVAVHGGSGISFGLVEQLRQARPEARFLELVHRLDKETSGVLLLAKKRSALTTLHQAIREGRIEKNYLTLVRGAWSEKQRSVSLPLRKYLSHAGERRVTVDETGRFASTLFTRRKSWSGYTLLEAKLLTGRTHQIRVHLAHLGFPIVGDDKYGDFEVNRALAKTALKRMFLHAATLRFAHPLTGEDLLIEAPLPEELQCFLDRLELG